MVRTLLIEPYAFLLNQYCELDGYAIYTKKTIGYWSDGVHKYSGIDYPDKLPERGDLDKIRTKITWNMPLWSRWMGQADRHEDYRQSSLLFVIRFIQVLQELNVKSVIFFTGVAHHIEYSLIEAACQVAGAQQIYLYPMPFFTTPNRLLPLVQNESIYDRRILGAEISSKCALQEVAAYRDNHLAAKPPQLNEKIDRVATSYPYALRQVAIFGLKALAKATLRRGGNASGHPIDDRQDYDCLSMLRIVQHQKAALDYYLSTMVNEEAVDRMLEAEGPLPVLYAHYQPEASTFPEGGSYSNHLDVVIEMRSLGYTGKILYKEHPGSWIYYSRIVGFSRVGLCRSVEYYRQLISLGCIFIPPHYKWRNNHLQQLFPVTITGSVALERSLIGFATCCAGLPWLKGAPGIFDLATTFGKGGVFFDFLRWRVDPQEGMEWFAGTLSGKTIYNYPGIGTGIVSDSATEMDTFLNEFRTLMNAIAK